jgi:hypothetical protein
MNALSKQLFAIGFLSVIFIVFALTLLGKAVAQIENRRLTPLPLFSFSSLSDPAFYKSLNLYLKDHLAERRAFIEANSALTISLFQQSPNPDVYLGSKGWLFATHPKACTGIPPGLTAARLLSFVEDLKAGGRRVVLIVAPSKEAVYPENLGYLPPAWSRCEMQRTGELMGAVHHSRVDSVDMLGQLSALKHLSIKSLYYPTGSHWTEAITTLMSRDIVETLRHGLWKPTALRTVGATPTISDLSSMLGVPTFETIEDLEVARDDVDTRVVEKESCPHYGPGCLVRYQSLGAPGTLIAERTIIIHDSFAEPIAATLPQYFSDVTFLTWSESGAWDDMLAHALQYSRIVILESYEPYLADRIATLVANPQVHSISRFK